MVLDLACLTDYLGFPFIISTYTAFPWYKYYLDFFVSLMRVRQTRRPSTSALAVADRLFRQLDGSMLTARTKSDYQQFRQLVYAETSFCRFATEIFHQIIHSGVDGRRISCTQLGHC
jgi:hypothetical protein